MLAAACSLFCLAVALRLSLAISFSFVSSFLTISAKDFSRNLSKAILLSDISASRFFLSLNLAASSLDNSELALALVPFSCSDKAVCFSAISVKDFSRNLSKAILLSEISASLANLSLSLRASSLLSSLLLFKLEVFTFSVIFSFSLPILAKAF